MNIWNDITLPSLHTKNDRLYSTLIDFCKDNDVSLSKMRSKSQKDMLVEYRARFAKRVYPEYNYRQIGELLNRCQSTVQHWVKYRNPITSTRASES